MNEKGVVMVTGAGGALGTALTSHLLDQGWCVAMVDRPQGLAVLEPVERGSAGRARAYGVDGSSVQAWEGLTDRVAADLKRPVEGVALVAGGWAGGAPLGDARGEDHWQAMMAANADTVFRALQGVIPTLKRARRGSIVLVGSRVVERPWSGGGSAAYVASKSAAVALAQVAAAEVLEDGVRVNAVLPSTLDTPANRRAMPDQDPHRWVALGSLVKVISFLLSDAAIDISGAAIPVYGRC